MRCLYCYQVLGHNEIDFHTSCSKIMFDMSVPPVLQLSKARLVEMASQIIKSHSAITGVQPKLSLGLIKTPKSDGLKKFTIVGLWGNYILKPPSDYYPQLPEVEDLSMHLANLAGVQTVPHCLIRLESGQLAYITRRIDRKNKVKIHMEDMCQLTERLTEHKYMGSYEQIAKTILRYSVNPVLDLVIFFEQVLFSFLIGNADMHLKNFSLIHDPTNGPILAPGYDMLSTELVNPDDKDELALTLNGKKRKITIEDFRVAFGRHGLDNRQQRNILSKMNKAKSKWMQFIDISFLKDDFKVTFQKLIDQRFDRLS